MALKIVAAKSEYEVASEGSVKISAAVSGASKKEEKILLFSTQLGTIDDRGFYKAPKTDKDLDDTIEVICVEDDSVKTNITIKVKAAKKTDVASSAEIKSHGSNGQYSISIQVAKTDKSKSKIIIIEDDLHLASVLPHDNSVIDPGKKHTLETETNDDGFYYLELKLFTEKSRTFSVRVIGKSLIDKKFVLTGPKKKPVVEFRSNGGFWKNLLQKF